MINPTRQWRISAAILLTMAIAACGGGSPGSSPTTSNNAGNNQNPTEGDGSNGNNNNTDGENRVATCFPPEEARMPAAPAVGESREGLICPIHIPIPDDITIPGNPTGIIGIQVFEPGTFEGGKSYPLVLDGHGFSQSRRTAKSNSGSAGLSVPNQPIIEAGYAMISIDQAGHGETGGLIRVMDPDQEGKFLIAILDWAEANIPWLAVGPDIDAGEDNILVGAVGPSYGGGYQMLLHSVDSKKRMDVLIPEITWSDLEFSIFPGTVPKALWGAFLFGAGNSAGNNEDRGHFDPFVQRAFANALSQGQVSDEALDYFHYHGMNYFCEGGGSITGENGDDGTIDTAGSPYFIQQTSPTPPGGVHAIFWQGMRDTLFNFSEAWWNYGCLKGQGGDVRLLSYQSGHNTLQVAPDPLGAQESVIGSCGTQYNATDSAIAFFDLHMKGVMAGATTEEIAGYQAQVDQLLPDPDEVCVSLTGTDAIVLHHSQLPVERSNTTAFSIADTPFTSGTSPLTPVAVAWDINTHGDALAGIPLLELNVHNVCDDTPLAPLCNNAAAPNRVVTFVGVGVFRNGSWQLVDNQVLPIRGTGDHEVPLIGIGERLNAGEQLGLLFYGTHEQFAAVGSLNAAEPTILPLTLSGTVHMPLVANATAAP